MPTFAMAGLAEAGMAQVVVLQFLGNVLIFVMALIVAVCGSRTVASVCSLMWLFELLLLTPWAGFFTRPNDDPDWNDFVKSFGAIAVWWAALSLLLWFTVIAVWFAPWRQRPAGRGSGGECWRGSDGIRS
jgi:hypothetical protein